MDVAEIPKGGVLVLLTWLSQVWTASWWMMLYGGRTPKRHVAYSNSAAIGCVDLGPLSRLHKRVKSDTTVKYLDRKGRWRYKGSKTLKATEQGPQHGIDGKYASNALKPSTFQDFS